MFEVVFTINEKNRTWNNALTLKDKTSADEFIEIACQVLEKAMAMDSNPVINYSYSMCEI